MRFRTLLAIAGWCGLAMSCAEVLGIDASGYTENQSGGSGGSGGAMGGGGAGGEAGCPGGAWYDVTHAWCVPEWASWQVPPDAPSQASYSWTADTVTDLVTGLVWQRQADVSGACDDGYCTWEEAHGYCFDLDLGGSQDWRLPSAIELASLVDYSQVPPAPNLDPTAFPSEVSGAFWSASCYGKLCPDAAGGSSAWFVDFGFGGYVNNDDVVNEYRVRCVR